MSNRASSSSDDLLGLLVENRAALDVLFEMMAFDRANGDEEQYRHFLDSMQARHKQAIDQYADAFDLDPSDLNPGAGPSRAETN